MANRIRPLRRTGSTGVPVVANMLDGEIAVNAFDKKIYMRVGSNLIEIANASSGDWNTLANKPTNFAYTNASQDVTFKDITADRGNGTGVIYFSATANNKYLFYNGSGYVLGSPGGGPDREIWHESYTGVDFNARAGRKFKAYDGNDDIANVEVGGGWTNGTDRVGYVINRNSGSPMRVSGRNTGVTLSVGETASQSTLDHELSVRGTGAGFNFYDRGGINNWTWYSTTGIARLWNNSVGDLLTISTGLATFGVPVRAVPGFSYGDGSYGGNITWNSVAAGAGASEYTNNRQGGSGGHLFSTRQNESQTPQQHHHLLSNGRMNIRNAAGGWTQQPRIFVGSGDPGAAAEPGDLWFLPV